MPNYNKHVVIGHLGRDCEIRMMQSGDKVANMTIATSETWKDKEGQKQTTTHWHNIVVFNQPQIKYIEAVGKFHKGACVMVEGRVETRKWTDKNGNDKYTTETVVRPYNGSVEFLSEPKGNSEYNQDTNQSPSDVSQDDLEDDIPF